MPISTVLRTLRTLLIVALLALGYAVPTVAQETLWPTEGWSTSTPEAQDLDGASFVRLDGEIKEGKYGYIDRMIVVRKGRLVVSQRYENDYRTISQGHESALGCGEATCGDDAAAADPYNYLHPSTHPFYHGRDVHTLQSVTKSVAATLIGIALTRGEIESVDAPLLSFFEDYDLSGVDERLHQATLEDLLTMRSGIEWHESDWPFDETNTTLQLEASDDWIQFTLDQPSDAAPGEKWVYNSGASHLMSGIIKKVTGSFIDAYAEAHLFGPLGIDDYHWKKTPKGFPDTEGGLYLEAEQLAKIGYLYLQGGLWDGQQILDADFVTGATARQVERVNAPGWGYGYQWWRLDRNGVEVWAGLGFGGQFLLVLPEHDLIGVVNSWNLFDRPQASIRGAFLTALIASVEG